MRRACFLDRDGILNEVILRDGVVSSPWNLAEFRLLPGAKDVVAAAVAAGFVPVVVTNQPDIERGNLETSELEKMHHLLRNALGLSEIEVCGTADNADPRRKPNSGMLTDAARRLGLDLGSSIFIGDSLKDVKAGRSAGVFTVLLETGYNASAHGQADRGVRSHGEMVDLLRSACDKQA